MPIGVGEAALGLGSQAIGGAIGAGMGLLLQKQQDKRQINQQAKLMRMEIAGQQEMGIFNREQQMKLWNDTGYGAQMDQIKKAGLNPGLLYGMGGGSGGTTAANAGNVTGAHAPTGGGEMQAMLAQGLQLGIMKAQKENIEADTANKTADTTNKGLDAELKDIEIQISSVKEMVAKATQNMQIAQVAQETEAGMKRLEILRNEAEISDKTKLTQINKATAELAAIWAEARLKQEGKKKTTAEIGQITKQVEQMVQKLLNETNDVAIRQQLADWETSLVSQGVDIVRSLVGIIPGLRGKEGKK